MSCVFAGNSFLKLVNDRLNRRRTDGQVTGYLRCTISILGQLYYCWARIQRYLVRYTTTQFNKITVQREYTIAQNDLHREIGQNLYFIIICSKYLILLNLIYIICFLLIYIICFLVRKINNFTKTLSLRAKLPNTYDARLYILGPEASFICNLNTSATLLLKTIIS